MSPKEGKDDEQSCFEISFVLPNNLTEARKISSGDSVIEQRENEGVSRDQQTTATTTTV